MAPVVAIPHAEGIRVLQYLDNWLIIHQDQAQVASVRDRTLAWSEFLLLVVRAPKLELTPIMTIISLGVD